MQELTKKERYLLKKQKKQEERFRRARKKKIGKIIKISIPIILVLGGVILGFVYFLSGENEESHSGTPKIEIIEPEYNAGTVSMADGLVKHTYEIANTGVGDLKIDRIWTSCMCTTARLRVGENTSSEFGMHSNPAFWSQKIAPGESGYLEVAFDPAFHGSQGTGQAVRTVYISTNDPENKKAEVKLSANVVQ